MIKNLIPKEYRSDNKVFLKHVILGETFLNLPLYNIKDARKVNKIVVPAITKAKTTKDAGTVYFNIVIIKSEKTRNLIREILKSITE